MQNFNNCMIDIETMSIRPDAAIIQVAAVMFSFDSDKVETFCMNSSLKSSIDLGLHIDDATVKWWKNRPSEVLASVVKDSKPIQHVIEQFDEFLGIDRLKYSYWCQGASFDFPVLDSAYRKLNRPVPWKYWNQRDTRTVYSIFGLDWRNYPRVGSYHNGLDDCLTQIKALKECLS